MSNRGTSERKMSKNVFFRIFPSAVTILVEIRGTSERKAWQKSIFLLKPSESLKQAQHHFKSHYLFPLQFFAYAKNFSLGNFIISKLILNCSHLISFFEMERSGMLFSPLQGLQRYLFVDDMVLSLQCKTKMGHFPQ